MKLAFIGAGNMGGALARAACRSLDPQEVGLTDYDAAKAEALAKELGCLTLRTTHRPCARRTMCCWP